MSTTDAKKRYALLDRWGDEYKLVRSKTSTGVPLCIMCQKPIPRQSWPNPKHPGRDARASRFFHSGGCAIKFAYRVAADVVKLDPELDVRIGEDIVAGPLLPHKPRPWEGKGQPLVVGQEDDGDDE